MKRYLADTFAMIVFSTACGAFIEIAIAGLSLDQSMRIRVSAIPIMLCIGRPYGIYRDWLLKLAGGENTGKFRAIVIDSFANFTFQISLYLTLLFANGATPIQALKASSAVALLLLVSGRPYGIFLAYCRALFGLPEE